MHQMAKSPRKTRVSGQPDEETEGLRIERDPTFVRIAADEAIVLNKSDGLHLALLVRGPDPVYQSRPVDTGGSMAMQQVRVEASLSEVARLRLPAPDAFNMAMLIVERTLASGRIKIAAFRAAIDALIEEHGHLDAAAGENDEA